MTEPNLQPSTERACVLMPTALDTAFDYLVPEGAATGALVQATLAGRKLVGVVWKQGSGIGDRGSEIPLAKLKPITRVLSDIPPLKPSFMKWLDWVSDFTLAPKGAVLGLCGLAHAAKSTRKAFEVQRFEINPPTLTAEQQAVVEKLYCHPGFTPGSPEICRSKRQEIPGRARDDDSIKPILLDGVTGSGKTEVYFHAIAKTVQEGGQILVLLPEIALTHQWLERFEKTFGATPIVWHSRMTPAAKARSWQAIARGEAQVVVGARSALFLPFSNLSLIVVDEEHDPSYKQEDGVLYHARDMAVARARFEQIPVLLVSATPSLETLENVREGKYHALHLTSRYGEAALPTVRLVDLRNDPPERGEFLSPIVKQAALETLARGEQVLFFLNRRGYAPLLLCRACGHRFQCGDCSAWLVVHGKRVTSDRWPVASASLHCHHCGHREKFPDHCPACNADAEKLAACGPGVERIAEEVKALVTGHRSLVTLSSDESITPETWSAIEKGEIDILVGTQMVAKGHHFPRLTLVVVVDADVGLDGADLRAGERTYQLLHQLGGRAGRGDLAGQVLVQTFCPEHPVMGALVAHDRDRLMALEARERKAGQWPPFGQLAAILLDGKDDAAVRAAGQLLTRTAPDDPRIRVLGPAPAPLSKLRGQYRYRLLVKVGSGIHLQRTLRGWLAPHTFKNVRVKVDVNPYYFL